MIELIAPLVSFAMFAFLIVLGLIAGSMTERRHFANLDRRQKATRHMLATQTRTYLAPASSASAARLLTAEVTVASDYLKSFLAKLRNIFGGEVRSFETLMERARREVTLRILEQAQSQGYNAICNLRLEAVDVGGNIGKKGVAMVTIMGSATAYCSELAKP